MKVKMGTAVGVFLIFGALAYGAGQFVTNLTPYVTFQEAKADPNRVFQVMGPLDRSKPIEFNGTLNFTIKEAKTGQTLPVRFKKSKPANFDQATQVTAIGSWNGEYFEARKLLVKCPSKYEEEVKAD
ncbi:cytochrome c maturation protein CcmE [Armatimonas sp.]|uniref:cytochrome c maturation protein CcmE domain-containing protein n=1 Tax=Armatimonas sp. TaxID=1872638 RepID=UPI00286C950B|nr:cytochrome c maturation protein CcmE [Armatimonas sp.]